MRCVLRLGQELRHWALPRRYVTVVILRIIALVNRKSLVIVGVLASLSSRLFADDARVNRRKAETILKADELFGQRYAVGNGKPLRYDQQTETGPPDGVIYWHGSSYVVELIFASDGTVARVELLPDVLLHSDNWNDVQNSVELSSTEMQWLVASADVLRPVGKAVYSMAAPRSCFQSGPNLYCVDQYEFASVSHYHLKRQNEKNAMQAALREISIWYRQAVNGIVENVRVEGSQRQIKVAGQWYHAEKPGVEIFDKAQLGSAVRLVSFGCTANEKACIAVPEQSRSTTAQHSTEPRCSVAVRFVLQSCVHNVHHFTGYRRYGVSVKIGSPQ